MLALAALLASDAYADDGKVRYVSGRGVDEGECLNKFRPCRSVDYAISRAGKADIVRVAEGEYVIDDASKLAKLLSVSGRIEGGFSNYSAYSEQNATGKTVLIGVPPELRERFESAGFTVIVDRKGIKPADASRMRKLTATILATEKSHGAATCVANEADGYPCQAVSLHSHLSLRDLSPTSRTGNDVWGFTDLNTLREYALIGLERGVAVVDVTDPTAPERVALVPGSATTWRDIKVYQRYDAAARRWRAYAYATADNVADFLMVLDLSELPNAIEKVSFSSDFRSAHNTYLVNADYTYGLALTPEVPRLGIAGGNTNGGNHRLYSLATPRSPSLLTVSTSGYAHDLASFVVGDSRKDSQCVNAQSASACQVMTDFNERSIDVWDITSPGAPRRLASVEYANAAYVHSGWWSEDGRYLFVHDELDESTFGLNTTVRVFDMSDLTAPSFVGSWVGPTRAIDHNGFVKGNRYYISNYAEGLTVLDITTPSAPRRIGYFDTYPATSETSFVGAWGVYPFFASGTIAVSDINTGLYLLENETLASNAGSFQFVDAAHSGSEGDEITLSVRRTGGAAGAVSVQLELLHASSQASDVSISSSMLSWADGDTADKTVTLMLNDDATDEEMELVLVRLKAPQGGATIKYPDTAYVHFADASGTPRLRMLEPSVDVDQSRAKAIVVVRRTGSAQGEARVSYRTLANDDYDGFEAVEGELIWADSEVAPKEIRIPLDASALAAGERGSFDVELFGAVGAELELDSGDTATTLLATVTVFNPSSASPPPSPSPAPNPPNPGGGGGGGGAIGFAWLVAGIVAMTLARRRRRTAPA